MPLGVVLEADDRRIDIGFAVLSPDQVAFLADPSAARRPAAASSHVESRWQREPLSIPAGVDPEAWAEYGFERAVETVVLSEEEKDLAYGCLMPFHPRVRDLKPPLPIKST